MKLIQVTAIDDQQLPIVQKKWVRRACDSLKNMFVEVSDGSLTRPLEVNPTHSYMPHQLPDLIEQGKVVSILVCDNCVNGLSGFAEKAALMGRIIESSKVIPKVTTEVGNFTLISFEQ